MSTLTLISGPACAVGLKIAVYQIDLDGYMNAGEAIDISGEFSKVFAVIPGGNDTLADNGIVIGSVLPGPTVAVTSSNVKLTAHWSADGTDGESLVELADNQPACVAIGQLSLVVIGA